MGTLAREKTPAEPTVSSKAGRDGGLPLHHIPHKPIVIRSSRGWHLGLGELVEYRELLYFLVWRDVKVRYKQTVLGAAWAVVQPFLLMVVFSVFLGKLAHVSSEGLPYPIFASAALVPWRLFASSLSGAATSLVSNANLVSRVY